MADFDYNSRKVITNRRTESLNERLKKVSAEDKALAKEIAENDTRYGNQITNVQNEFLERKDLKPSQWFGKKGLLLPRRVHQGLLDAFVSKVVIRPTRALIYFRVMAEDRQKEVDLSDLPDPSDDSGKSSFSIPTSPLVRTKRTLYHVDGYFVLEIAA